MNDLQMHKSKSSRIEHNRREWKLHTAKSEVKSSFWLDNIRRVGSPAQEPNPFENKALVRIQISALLIAYVTLQPHRDGQNYHWANPQLPS